jgi:hypothetical protein
MTALISNVGVEKLQPQKLFRLLPGRNSFWGCKLNCAYLMCKNG